MRPHWRQASPIVRRTIEQWLGSSNVPAEAWLNAANAAFSAGFDIDPPPVPTLQELDRLRAAGDTTGVARIYATRRVQLEAERHAQNYYTGLAGWRASKSTREAAT